MSNRSLLPIVGALVLAAVLLAGIPYPAAAGTAKIRVSGTGSGLGLMKALATEYMKMTPGTSVEVLPSLGSSGGVKALLQGVIDISISSRPLKEDERAKGAEAVELARTPFVFVSHRQAPVTGVSLAEIEALYGGKTLAWQDGAKVRLVLRAPDDIDTIIVRGMSPGMAPALDAAQKRPGMIIAPNDQECLDSIGAVAGAFGASSLVQLMTEKHQVKMLALNGVTPSVKAMSAGRYPLHKSLYLVTTRNATPAVLKFQEFLKSSTAGKLMGKLGCEPVAVSKDR